MSWNRRVASVASILTLLTFCLTGGISSAQVYDLRNDVLDDGGTKMTSGGYILRGSFGQPTIGKITSTNYIAYIGFWHPPYASPPGVEEDLLESSPLPRVFSLSQNYPNPVSRSTTIQYGLPKEALVDLRVFNVVGQRVRTLINEKQEPGYYRVTWDLRGVTGGRLPNGVYFYRIKAGNFVSTKKLVVLR